MSLFITSLNSGSNGNCYYIGNEHEAVLVDVGISCRETEKRMNRLGLSIHKVKAIFISHEHSDHISGVPLLAKKHNIPVYITPKTLLHLNVNADDHQILHFIAYQPVIIGGLTITAFPKFHDAIEPHSFIISCGKVTVGVFTDIGAACEHLISHFSKCHAAFLEANYDDEMLDNGSYPFHLKRRIRSGRGHLSNKQALELFVAHKPPFMSHLFLSHLSKNNNCPDLVYELFHANAKGTEIIVASRHEETAVYQIGKTAVTIGRAKQLAFEL
jgi:phosphoribosyl 1,2-cyclic phosphodiesterase